MFDLLMVKYAELNTKGGNQRFFINKLESNIKNILFNFSDINISANRDRILVHLNGEDSNSILNILSKLPGIQNISPAYIVKEKSFEAITEKIKTILPDLKQSTFRVDVVRSDKSFSTSSTQMSKLLGSFVTHNSDLKVDLINYDHKIKVEIRKTAAYIYTDTTKGIGGLPVGTSAKALLLLSGGIDSPVASFEMMKRGVPIDFLHFASPPSTGPESLAKVKKLAKQVSKYNNTCNLHIVNFMEIQTEIFCGVDERYRITLMRRLFYKIAKIIANEINALAIVTGESIGQVASQTLESIHSTSSDLPITIFRPLITQNKEKIIKIAKQIGTFNLSISKGEDCCSLFVPKNPVTKPKFEYTLNQEKQLLIENMIEKAVQNREIINIKTGE